MRKRLENEINLELNSSNFTAKVINSPQAEGDIMIPRSFFYQSQEFIITSIGEQSFDSNEFIESISFPEDSKVQTIEEDAFSNSFLASLSFPPSIKYLTKGWCESTSNLYHIDISPLNNHYKLIDNLMIVGKFDESCIDYEILHFASRKINRIIIPSFIKRIEAHSFSECFGLREVIFEENSQLISIGDFAFSNTPIESIILPKTLKQIGEYAFAYCINLKSIEFMDDSELTSIENGSFSNCSIEKFVIPKHVTHIGKDVFNYCWDLQSIEFAQNSEIKKIGEYSFKNIQIENILIPKSVTQIGEGSFMNCKNLLSVEFEQNSELQSIDKYAFYKSSIEKLYLSEKVDDLKEEWCSNISNLSHISISPKNKRYSVFDGSMIIGKTDINEENFDVLNFVCRNVERIIIPSFIKRIDSDSVSNCMKLTDVVFTENCELTTFGKFSFSFSSITNIIIPKNFKLIEEGAFSNCSKLKSVEFLEGNNSITIDKNAFFDSSLHSIYFSSNIAKLKPNWCAKTQNLVDVKISPNNKRYKYINDSMLIGKKDNDDDETFNVLLFVNRVISHFIIPTFIKYIGSSAFADTKNLHSVEFESDINLIEDFAFARSSIKSILIPKTVRKIGENCFDSCEMLKKVILLNNSELNCIESHAFYKSSIESIFIPKKVRKIGSHAFNQCFKLSMVEFDRDSDVESIMDCAFAATKIKSFSVPKKVCQIGQHAFDFCQNLRSVEFLSNDFSIHIIIFAECRNLFIISFPNAQKVSIKESEFLFFKRDLSVFLVPNSDLILI